MKEATRKAPRKKKVAVSEAVSPSAPSPSPFSWRGPEHRDDALYFAREDLLFVCLTEARGINALQATGLHRAYLQKMAERHENEKHVGELEMARLTGEAATLERFNQQMWADVGQLYGVDFSAASYDDTTGRITLLNEPGDEKKETQDG